MTTHPVASPERPAASATATMNAASTTIRGIASKDARRSVRHVVADDVDHGWRAAGIGPHDAERSARRSSRSAAESRRNASTDSSTRRFASSCAACR